MKNLLKKVLTLVSALALLVSSTAMVYAEEEQTEAPVAEASDINAEAEALAAQQAAEEEAAQQAAEEEAARIAAEEAAKKAAEEEAARIAAEEAAKKAAEEEAARIAAEEAAKKAAEEEAARIAAEEAAKKAAEEEAARIAAEEAEKKAAEEEAARIAAEEAAKQSEEVPSDNNNEETLSEEKEDSEDGEIVELSDDWGYVDPEIIADYVPEVTVELKYPDIRELKINEKLSGTIDAENDAEMFIRCGGNKTIVLGLYASSENVAVEINGNAVNFTKAELATATTDFYSTYELKVAAGREYTIILSSSTPVSYKITADDAAKQTVTEETVKEETAVTEEAETQETENNEAAAENTEAAAAEETEVTEAAEETETAETAEETETAKVTTEETETTEGTTEETETAEATEETETAEGTTEETEAAEGTTDETETSEITTEEKEATEVSEETENTEEAEAASEENTEETSGEEGIEGSDTEENTEVEITEEEVPAVKGWITVDKETFEIGDTVTLTANADIDLENMVAWQTKVQNAEEWTGAGYGETLTVELTEENINNSYRFRMEDESYSEEYTLTAKVEEAEETEETAEEAEEETEETETTEENTEVEETETDEGTVEAEETEEIEKTDEEMAALGYIKAVVTSEEGAKVFESIDPEAIEVETLGAGTEIWILKQEDGWALLYSGSEEDAVRYIRLSDTDAFEEEIVPYEESWYADNSDLEVLLIDETGNPLNNHKAYASVTTVEGEETIITQSIIVDNLAEDEHCEYQWYYSLNGGESWELIPEGTTDANAYVFSFDMWLRSWKAVVTIKK